MTNLALLRIKKIPLCPEDKDLELLIVLYLFPPLFGFEVPSFKSILSLRCSCESISDLYV